VENQWNTKELSPEITYYSKHTDFKIIYLSYTVSKKQNTPFIN